MAASWQGLKDKLAGAFAQWARHRARLRKPRTGWPLGEKSWPGPWLHR